MECNKDEATKAKEIAEKKMGEKDYKEARKFALKAQSLFPGIDGVQQLLMIINIYTSSEEKINGVVDWYGVLGIDPSSDDEALRKQYRKLALILHPDKNRSVGAEGAFKLVSEAWSLLSDKAKRTTYDQKRTACDHKRTFSRIFEKVIPTRPTKPMGPKRSDTFWTVCTNCKMQFEYVLLYLNKKLQCYSCKKPFLALPTTPPQTNSRAPSAGKALHDTSNHPSGKTCVSTSGNGPVVYSGNVRSVPPYSSAANRNEAQVSHGERTNENAQTSASLESVKEGTTTTKRANGVQANGMKPRKRRRAHELKMNEGGKVMSDQLSMGSRSFGVGSVSGSQINTSQTENMISSTRELSLVETRNMFIDKAKKDISKKMDEWKKLKPKQHAANKTAKLGENGKAKYPNEEPKTSSTTSSSVSETQASDQAMTVPDSDFHDFDKRRTENSFGDNQVWAAYDNEDGMPRFYALIHNVLSSKPFKMRISWLNSKSTAEFGNLNWVGCGFYKTSGDFRVGKHELNKTVNSFSHRVNWSKAARGAIRIFPSKGDVWALYKNWSSEWNAHTPDETIHQYEMVEVLTDYDEEKGMTVVPLVKVAGFKTVFRQHMDQKQVRVVPREEMFRFSHQVPSYLLTDKEYPHSAKGCLELDPAAIPSELLQLRVETSENLPKENTEEVANGDPSGVKKPEVKEPIRIEIASEMRTMEDGIKVHLGEIHA